MLDSLRCTELGLLLDEAGLRLSESQLARLSPYLTSVHRLEAVSGQLRTKAQVFARRGSAALAIDGTSSSILFGYIEAGSPLRNVERYASPEVALRRFLSVPGMASNNRWSDRGT